MRIALLGQPNTGKSTLFNRVAGVKARTSNLPGTTVRVNESAVRINGEEIILVDLPGTYSLTPLDPAQAE
ncbi:MAG: FeoB small GTPase domain-containing protein, partial [Candidatus Hydrothermia bacterium]